MRTLEEIVSTVHERADVLRRRRIRLAGGACIVLAVILLTSIGAFGGMQHCLLDMNYAGSSMLDESAGGYVLVALVAFMLGVFITSFFKWRQGRMIEQNRDQANLSQEDEGVFLDDEPLAMAAGGKKEPEEPESGSEKGRGMSSEYGKET